MSNSQSHGSILHPPYSILALPTPFAPPDLSGPIRTHPDLSGPSRPPKNFSHRKFFLPSQAAWIEDDSPLKIIQKSRQVGITYADAYDSVRRASHADARFDVWVSSRDEAQARLYLEDCKYWADVIHLAAHDLGEVVLDGRNNLSAQALQFANGRRIYCLSSNPNALAGKRGHVKLDEFALHEDQRLLYRVAKPVTMWGGHLSIISTHRGVNTLFNQLIRDITQNGNPMGWSLHSLPIQKAVDEGLVERINQKSGRHESRADFLKRIRAECIDEEQWLQEYCCLPADESAAFISYDLLTPCEDPDLRLLSPNDLIHAATHLPRRSPPFPDEGGSPTHSLTDSLTHDCPLFLGMDIARKHHLCVIDVGEKIGPVIWDRLRLELQDRPFSEIKAHLYDLLRLRRLERACIDATGLGMQLAEEARADFGWKVEPVTFTPATKEDLAFTLQRAFEDRTLRIPCDPKLRADLRAIKKSVTTAGNIRFLAESDDSHCDRFWAKALRQRAARPQCDAWALVG